MFDDPKKALRRMEEELFAAEAPEPEEAELPLGDALDFADGDWLQEVKDLLEPPPTPPARKKKRQSPGNDAVDFHRTVYADEELSESRAMFVEKKHWKKQNQKKGLGCLPFVLLMEIAGIGGLIWWWIRWLS